MDHWGLPRAFVTEGVGGAADSEDDRRLDLVRMVRSGPRLVGLQARSLLEIARAPAAVAALQTRLEGASDLRELIQATAFGLGVALRTNFAINGALTGLVRVRRFLGLKGRARVTTEVMMEEYEGLRSAPPESRGEALDAWLGRFGHRGPLESDPARPRFAELREVLRADLDRPRATEEAGPLRPRPTPPPARGPLYALDRRRESFRDDLMRAWQILRERILSEARRLVAEGRLEEADDVFLLTFEDLVGPLPGPAVLAARREERQRLAAIPVPATAPRDAIEAVLQGATGPSTASPGTVFQGIGLGDFRFEGRVRRARDLLELLRSDQHGGEGGLDHQTVLVVPALEPSWAVVFGRVGAVVAELGGELSHASILLREVRTPAVVNCTGVYEALADGDRVRLDGASGLVERVGSGEV
jgi:pyruvate,water dikinase